VLVGCQLHFTKRATAFKLFDQRQMRIPISHRWTPVLQQIPCGTQIQTSQGKSTSERVAMAMPGVERESVQGPFSSCLPTWWC